MIHTEKHEFALYIDFLSSLLETKKIGDQLLLSDPDIFHRMVHVLRMHIQDYCVLFDRHIKTNVILQMFENKKHIYCIIQSIQPVIPLEPTIIFLLPFLKRDDYETALYNLTEVGVNTIQLVVTQKTMNQKWEKKEKERAHRILVAAAEQSKNFAYPEIKAPLPLDQVLKIYSSVHTKIFFDPEGKNFFDITGFLYNDKPQQIVLFVGPEGDLNNEEKTLVSQNKFIFCALTPTVIRSVQAAALGAGFVRSLVFK